MSDLRDNGVLGAQDAAGLRFALVVSRTNGEVTDRLVEDALAALERYGADRGSIELVEVPGAFELPMAAAKLARLGRFDAIVCIGAIIRGQTPHFDYLASAVAHGIERVALESGIPVTFGVLTCDSMDQALARAGGEKGNKGSEAAVAAIEMARTFAALE